MRARVVLGQLSYAAGSALAVVVIAAGLYDLAFSSSNPVGPALLVLLAATAIWLTGRATRFLLLPTT